MLCYAVIHRRFDQTVVRRLYAGGYTSPDAAHYNCQVFVLE